MRDRLAGLHTSTGRCTMPWCPSSVFLRRGTGITPSSHRGGGATWFFQATGNLELTRWRGRWQQNRTLEVYLQEVAAASLLPELSPDARRRVQVWADLAPMLLHQTVAALDAASPVQTEARLAEGAAGSLDAYGPPRA